jgi:hypothetical protein
MLRKFIGGIGWNEMECPDTGAFQYHDADGMLFEGIEDIIFPDAIELAFMCELDNQLKLAEFFAADGPIELCALGLLTSPAQLRKVIGGIGWNEMDAH